MSYVRPVDELLNLPCARWQGVRIRVLAKTWASSTQPAKHPCRLATSTPQGAPTRPSVIRDTQVMCTELVQGQGERSEREAECSYTGLTLCAWLRCSLYQMHRRMVCCKFGMSFSHLSHCSFCLTVSNQCHNQRNLSDSCFSLSFCSIA